MSIKGGYTIIDFKNVALTTDDTTGKAIAGVYGRIEGNHNKPILISGLVLDNVEYDDFFVNFAVSSTDFVAAVYLGTTLKTITIDDDDVVVIEDVD